MLEKYEKLLNFICDQVLENNFNILMKSFREFMREEFKIKSPLVFASIDFEKSREPIIRDFYNKKVRSEYDDEVYLQIKESIKTNKPISNSDTKFNIVSLGKNHTQHLYMVLEGEFEEKIFKSIEKYIQKKFVSSIEFKKLKTMKGLAHLDDVTGLGNQRKFKEDIDDAIKEFDQLERSFSLIFIDIDYFKSINDGHGHLIGTSLLRQVGDSIKSAVREDDLCFRYGGDEFVILAPDSSLKDAKMIGDRILNKVKSTSFKIDADLEINDEEDNEVKLSVSIGVANYPLNASNRNEIIGMADKMMYEAKNSGRGKVCVAE